MASKKNAKRAVAAMLAVLLGSSGTTVLMPKLSVQAADQPSNPQAKVPGTISVDPSTHYQTLEGWGTSLCWWGNVIGDWGDEDFNKNGRPDREEIAELAFSPEYLNLNIVRYNVGGGDKEDSSIARYEGLVPGWTEDMTGTKDGTGEFQEEAFYAKETEEMSDAGQLWMLEQANQYRSDLAEQTGEENDIINEVFSNSPPYYMTKSGSSTGGTNEDKNNLKEDAYDDFALYMARAAKWIDNDLQEKFGVGVDFIEPLNEPDTNYWMNGSTKQEGCIFNTAELQSKAYREMQMALDNIGGLEDVKITGTDETSLWSAINSFNRLEDDVKENMDTIGAHTYSGNDSERHTLRRTAASYDKGLWMSEITKGGGRHDASHSSMSEVQTKAQSEGIMADLKYMQPSAWVAWLIADSEYECLQTNENWGLIHAVFEPDGPNPNYHTKLIDSNGNAIEGLPEEGYWAVTKQFYTMMQYSKYLKAGYIMIDIGDSNMCAAVSPEGDELVIVAQNFGSDRNTTVNLSRFENLTDAEVYRTSDDYDCELIETQEIGEDQVLTVSLPQNSVTTYLLKAEDGKQLCDMENYSKIIDGDVAKPEENWTDDLDKFTYTGTWGESGDADGKYSTTPNSSVTFKFEGNQAIIYGTKGSECGEVTVSVDGGEAQTVDLSGEGKDVSARLFDTGTLSDGTHTVTISKLNDDKLLEINYAQLVTGELKEEAVKATAPDVYTISGIKPVLPDTVTVETNQGNTSEQPVTWDLTGVDFTKNATIVGTVEGVPVAATVNLKLVEENMQYFIDCNSLNSPVYREMDAYADLLNEAPDQKYTSGSWGYLAEYGAYNHDNVNDIYMNGWYAKGGQSIQYTVPLKAGTYNVKFGFREWWNQSRPMKVSMTAADGTTTELGTTNSLVNGNAWNSETYQIKVEQDREVTFTVAKNDGPDPVLSFIQIQAVLDQSALKHALRLANAVDTSKWEADQLEALQNAYQNAYPLLYQAGTTQEALNQAAQSINDLLKDASVDTSITKEKLEENDYILYTVNCGTSDSAAVPSGDKIGLMQFNVDQLYGEDAITGWNWGRNPDNEYSKAVAGGAGTSNAYDSYIYMSDDEAVTFDKYKSGLGYTFEIPTEKIEGVSSNTFEVTVGFKMPSNWGGSKLVNVSVNDKSYLTDVELKPSNTVTKTITVTLEEGADQLNVMVRAPRRENASGDPMINYIQVKAVEETEKEIITYDSITGVNGEIIYDTNGNQIQAHGGQIQKVDDTYYWIGEDKSNEYRPVAGIHVYSSKDLYNWKDEGIVLQTMENPDQFENDEYFKALYGDLTEAEQQEIFIDLDKNNCVMERPKMIYNEKNKQWVIWFHADGRTPTNTADYGKAKAGVAVSDSPTGPFKLLGSYKLHHAGDNYGFDGEEGIGSVRDMNLFKDDNGEAYVIYSSEGNETTYISRLNEDYTGLAKPQGEAVEGEDFVRAFAKQSREAPAMFKYQDHYYIINSGCTGWNPNQAQYAVADHPFGPWKVMGDPCTDEGSSTTYDTQSTCVFPVDAEKGQFIYMGDRWNNPDKGLSIKDSTYVWLPVEFMPNQQIALRRYADWTLDVLENMGSFELKTELPTVFNSVFEITQKMPKTVIVLENGEEIERSVSWSVGNADAQKLGVVTVTGTLDSGRSFSHQVSVVRSDILYFFDSGAKTSEYFDLVKEQLGDQLLNGHPDQQYTEESKAGYANISQWEESEEANFEIGNRQGDSMLENGWWAKADKSIDYKFDVEPGAYQLSAGFCEWWTATRNMKITISMEDKVLGERNVYLKNGDTDVQANQTFVVPEAGTITVSISKAGGGDPVLAWIALLEDHSDELQTPENVEVTKITDTTATVTWHAVENAESYQVFVNGKLAGEVKDNSITLEDLTPETKYTVTVKAVKGDIFSDASAEVSFTTEKDAPVVEVPTAPENVTATDVTSTTAKLTWDAVDNAESYQVFVNGKLAEEVENNSVTLEDLNPETEYTVTVKAVNEAGESDPSEEVTFTTEEETKEETATISGTIVGEDQEPIENAIVILYDGSGKEIARTRTGANGAYSFDVGEGSYSVQVVDANDKPLSDPVEVEISKEQVESGKDVPVEDIETEQPETPTDRPTEEDIQDLKDTIEKAKDYDKSDYTLETYLELERVIAAAEELLTNSEATKDAYLKAISDIEDAIDQLQKVEKPDPQPPFSGGGAVAPSADGWKFNGIGWWYDNGNGSYTASNWQLIEGEWYYFDANGYMATGWIFDGANWFYLNPNADGSCGKMMTGWVFDGTNWFYLNPVSDGTRGAMVTGWLFDNDYQAWFYLNPNADGTCGRMMTGWNWVDGKCYYLNPNGSLVVNGTTPDGYQVDASGAWIR